MKGLHMITWILLVIGGLNWGLEAFGWGLANWLPMGLMKLVYILVGLSAIYELFTHKGNCKACGMSGMSKPMGQM